MNDQPVKRKLSLPVDAKLLVPHRRPIRMIDRLVEFTDTSGIVEALVGADNLLVNEEGALDSIAFMELMAQAYAAVKGYYDLSHHIPVKKGFLVAVKHMEVNGESHLGDLLKIHATTISEVGGFAIAEGTIMCEDEILASASLTLWVP